VCDGFIERKVRMGGPRQPFDGFTNGFSSLGVAAAVGIGTLSELPSWGCGTRARCFPSSS